MRKSQLRQIAEAMLPPALVKAAKSVMRPGIRFTGPYVTWEKALQYSTGYDDSDIMDKVLTSTRAVKEGKAFFERDSVLFYERQFVFPLLSVILRAAVDHGGAVTTLDFGGSLGSLYFQHKEFLSGVKLRWHIVEQDRLVEIGRENFEDDTLKFFASIKESLFVAKPDILVLSGVLQYLQQPHDDLSQMLAAMPDYIVIDRTPFAEVDSDTLLVQHVPAAIYKASYPCWVLSRPRLVSELSGKFELVCGHDSLEFPALARRGAGYVGMIWRRRPVS